MARRACLPILVVVLAISSATARTGPEGRIRAICFGDVIDQYGGFNSFVVIRLDPAIEPTLIPSRPDYLGSYENAWRNMRIYMPRTYAQLVEGHDLLLTSDADRMVFRTEWIDWMTRSVTDGGLGLEWLGSIQSGSFESWEGTTLAEVAPVSPAPDMDVSGLFRVIIVDSDEPLMGLLPWEQSPPLNNLNTQIPKDGSQIWAMSSHPDGYPLITYWENGEGTALCFASKFPNGVARWAREWDPFTEAMIFLSYRTVERALPDDALMFSEVLDSFEEYSEIRSMVMAVFAFVERFGGRFDRLYRRLDEIASSKATADGAYLEGDYEACLDLMLGIRREHTAVMDEAMDAKDAALLWVYVTEWCALTATLLISGAAVWHLMVRRRLYREVGVSRMVAR